MGYILSKMEGIRTLSSFTIKNFQNVDLSIFEMLENLSRDSILGTLFIGVLLSTILTILFVRRIARLELYQEIRRSSIREIPFWQKYYVDVTIVVIVTIIQLLAIQGFNLIPSFVDDLYNMLVPLLSWVGFTLLAIRISIYIINKQQYRIKNYLSKKYGTSGIAIGKSLVRNYRKLIAPIFVLLLALSLTLTVANVTDTFNNQAQLEANYAVGADIRIQFPDAQQLEFRTSDFKKIINNIPGISATEIFITLFDFGRPALAVVIDPIEFSNIAYFRDDFFYYDTPEESLTKLGESEDGLGMILSFNLGFPFADGYDDISRGPPTFDQNDTIPFSRSNVNYKIPIFDIAIRLPGLSDLVGRPSEDLPFLIMNNQFFTEPLENQSKALAPELQNATHMFIDVDENVISIEEAEQKIMEEYEKLDVAYGIAVRTVEDYEEEFFELGDLLLGLTQLEFLTMAILLILTQFLYVLSEHDFREKEYAILMGMGWKPEQIRAFLATQISFIAILGVVMALIISPFITYSYIPSLSNLFQFSIDDVIFSGIAMAMVIVLVFMSTRYAIKKGGQYARKTDIAEVLRGI